MKALLLSALPLAGRRGIEAQAMLTQRLAAGGLEVVTVGAAAAEVSPCRGCGACGLRGAGRCVIDNGMQSIYREIVAAQVLALAGPVRLGSHCPQIKTVVDRLQPLMASVYAVRAGELKFLPRYDPRPAILGVGLAAGDDCGGREETDAFRRLITRHALNIDAPAHAAALLHGADGADDEEAIERALAVLGGDRSPEGLESRAPAACPGLSAGERSTRPRRVQVIQGSPRRRSNTRSIVAGLVAELEGRDVAVEVFRVPAEGAGADEVAALARLLSSCDALVVAAPLYFDGLPAVTQDLLERLLARRAELRHVARPVYGLAHSGFPESANREPLLRSMKLFADALDWSWCGGVEFGATSPIDGRPLEETGMFDRRVRNGLPLLAADIAAGRPFRGRTRARCRRSPFFPLPLRPMIGKLNGERRNEARERGADLFARPYADPGAAF